MQSLTLHCLTGDPDLAEALRGLSDARELDFQIRIYDPGSEPTLSGDGAHAGVLMIDVDFYGEEVTELLPGYAGAGSIVVGSVEQERALGQATSMFDSELLLKDPDYHLVSLIPIMVRKILRNRDLHTTHEDIIRSSERRYEDLVQAIPDVVYKIDPDGYFVFVNESIRSLGYEPDDLLGRHFSRLVAEEELPRISRRYLLPKLRGTQTGSTRAPGLFDERRTGDRRTNSLEIRLKKKSDGGSSGGIIASLTSYGEITATGHYLGDTAERHFTGTVGIIRDITQRRQSEERLTQLSLAIEQIAVGVCITDHRGVVSYANPFFFRLNMLEPGKALGANLRRFARRYLQEETFSEIIKALSAEEAWEADRIVWKRSGESYWSWLKVYPVRNVEGTVAQYIIFQQDITERKRGESNLRRALETQRLAVRSIHHRVRASLETLSSLTTSIADAAGEHPITPERLIRYVAEFHEFAHEGNETDHCDLGSFLETGLAQLLPVESRRSRRFGLQVDVTAAGVPVLLALPLVVVLGTIVTIVANRIFPRQSRDMIVVTGEVRDHSLAMSVRHPGETPFGGKGDGSGTEPPGTGELELITATISQVDGSFDTRDAEGYTSHHVTLPLPTHGEA